MPYSNPDDRRRVWREAQRRRRARQLGTLPGGVNPSTPASGAAPLSPADLGALVAEELAAVRSASEAGSHERARIVALLVQVGLRCFEMSDLTARVEQLEHLFEDLAENGRRTIHAV
mgnify:CR=1 FL=1